MSLTALAPARVSLIAAMATNRAIGADNRLLWRLPDDLKYFRRITRGHPVIMGRKTYESIGHPLPERQNLVITRQVGLMIQGVEVVSSLEEALRRAKPNPDEVFVIGGAEIYSLALARADRLYLTLVNAEIAGDAFFPEWRESDFREVASEAGIDEASQTAYRFTVWDRATPSRL